MKKTCKIKKKSRHEEEGIETDDLLMLLHDEKDRFAYQTSSPKSGFEELCLYCFIETENDL